MTKRASPSTLTRWLWGAIACCLPALGCGPAVPAHPGYAADVQPILQARCFRCHGGGQPDVANEPFTASPEYVGTNGITVFNTEALVEASPIPSLMEEYIHGKFPPNASQHPPLVRMPPPPDNMLESWQLETLDHWTSDVIAGMIVP